MKMTDRDWERALAQAKEYGAEPERIWIPVENFRKLLLGGGYTNAEIKRLIEKLRVSERHVCLSR